MTLLELASITKIAALNEAELQSFMLSQTYEEAKHIIALLEELEDMMFDARQSAALDDENLTRILH